MFCEYHPFWCDPLHIFIATLLGIGAIFLIPFIAKKFNELYAEDITTTSSTPTETTEEKNQTTEESQEEEKMTDEYDKSLKEWMKENKLEDTTNTSIFLKFFQLENPVEIEIHGHDVENSCYPVTMVLPTKEIIKFNLPDDVVDFFQDDTFDEPQATFIFTDDFEEEEFEFDQDNKPAQNMNDINWDENVMTSDNLYRVNISLSMSDYKSSQEEIE